MWLVNAWLLCQLGGFAGAPVLALSGSMASDECGCPNVAHGQTCPMHQRSRKNTDDGTCKMRSRCQPLDVALLSMAGGPGVLPRPTDVVTAFDLGAPIGALVPSTALAVSLTLAVPGRSNATPTVAAEGAFVTVAWSATLPAGSTDIFAAVSRDGARTFGAAVRVNDVDGDARVNGEQPPRIALVRSGSGDPSIAVVWTAKGSTGTRLVSSRSLDGGRTFSRATTVPDSDAAGNRGWHNVAAGGGRIFTIWLDHRGMADHAMGAAPHHEAAGSVGGERKNDGVAMAQKSQLYVATLDGSVAPHPIAAGVCYCCKTAIAVAADGAIYAAWRHVYPGNMRDIAFTVSRDGGRTFAPPVRVSEDRWMLEGCPDDGPAIAVDGGNRVHIAWPTLVTNEATGEPTKAVFYATSRDGRTFTPRTRVPVEGVAGHPQVVVGADGSPTIAWDESAAGSRRTVLTTVPSFMRTILSGDASGVYPSLAVAGETTIAAWTAAQPSGSVVRVQRLGAPAKTR